MTVLWMSYVVIKIAIYLSLQLLIASIATFVFLIVIIIWKKHKRDIILLALWLLLLLISIYNASVLSNAPLWFAITIAITAGIYSIDRIICITAKLINNVMEIQLLNNVVMIDKRDTTLFFLWLLLLIVTGYYSPFLSIIPFWLALAIAITVGIYSTDRIICITAKLINNVMKAKLANNVVLMVVSTMFVVIAFELYLGYFGIKVNLRNHVSSLNASLPLTMSSQAAEAKAARKNIMVMLPEWEVREVTIPGAKRAYYWHDVLHVFDEHNFRRTTPFPVKQPGKYRIMVVGDSLTYGYGIKSEWTYPALLQTHLKKFYNIEVINLGVCGYQVFDVLKVIIKYLPKLRPDLVIYGVCMNDFLPPRNRQYIKNPYEIPIPDQWKSFLIKNSLAAKYLEKRYSQLLLKLNLTKDFYDEILDDFHNYQEIFAKNVVKMNEATLSYSLPPIVAIVLDQNPRSTNERPEKLKVTNIAEELLNNAGMDVIETKNYYEKYREGSFVVSVVEKHPDEEAHAIFADMILQHIKEKNYLIKHSPRMKKVSKAR